MLSFVYVFMAIWLQWIPTFLWMHLPASVRKRLLHTFAFLVCNNRLRFPASNSAHAIKNQHWYYWICEFYENVSFLKYQKSSAERVFQKVIVVKKKRCYSCDQKTLFALISQLSVSNEQLGPGSVGWMWLQHSACWVMEDASDEMFLSESQMACAQNWSKRSFFYQTTPPTWHLHFISPSLSFFVSVSVALSF